jgi:predicted RNA methylase
MAQDTGKFRKNEKDQYYTRQEVAKSCVDKIQELLPQTSSWLWIEPSAGNGSFLKACQGLQTVGIDIDPKAPGIQKGDFLQWTPLIQTKRIVFGNPPFGRQGSMAKAFIQHAAEFSDCIAFILPRSFVKPSMSRAFPLAFHCLHSEEIAKNSFEVNGSLYDVPCVFQIWEKRLIHRQIQEAAEPTGFHYVKEDYDFAFRRVGGKAGTCYPKEVPCCKQAHYFLRLDSNYKPQMKKIMDAVNAHVFPSNTVGPRSLSKGEVNEILNGILADLPE